MADERHVQLDGTALRVLAHPLRSRLLSALRKDGPANATTLASRLATNTGATSYHLRKLAEVGLVVETGDGTGKQRWWRAAQESHGFSDADAADDPDALAAASWLRQHYWRHFTENFDRWEQARSSWPLRWRDAAGVNDALLDLTADQARELMAELQAVVDRYQRAASPGATDTRRISVLWAAMPGDPDQVPER